ncbi:Uma2 family endonuclease [Cohnella sp. GCM10020058]|uniref:Uma2 family endonuclease n=1 Tax=Cohnella sp. GCM10020058 TaxID=3317330 RepID=UPI003638B078
MDKREGGGMTAIKRTHGTRFIDERYEIIDGVRHDFLTSPKFVHQDVLGQLHLAFHASCAQDGVILLAPLDVHFDKDNILQPDLLYISRTRSDIIRDGYVYGAPDLVVEILSDSTAHNDKTIKKGTYERFGVAEYWLVEPEYRLVDQFVLTEGEYRLVKTWTAEDEIVSSAVPCLAVNLSEVFRHTV